VPRQRVSALAMHIRFQMLLPRDTPPLTVRQVNMEALARQPVLAGPAPRRGTARAARAALPHQFQAAPLRPGRACLRAAPRVGAVHVTSELITSAAIAALLANKAAVGALLGFTGLGAAAVAAAAAQAPPDAAPAVEAPPPPPKPADAVLVFGSGGRVGRQLVKALREGA